MFKHIVVFKFKKENPEAADKVKAMLEALPPKIDLIKSFEVGKNQLDTYRSYDLILISEFDNQQDYEAYVVHPDHKKVSEYVAGVRENSVAVDYEF